MTTLRTLLGWASALLGLAMLAFGVVAMYVARDSFDMSIPLIASDQYGWIWGYYFWCGLSVIGLALMIYRKSRRWGAALLACASLTIAVIFHETWQAAMAPLVVAMVQASFALSKAPPRAVDPERPASVEPGASPPWLEALAARDEDV